MVNHSDPEIDRIVTHILMDDEKYTLSNWERRDIFDQIILENRTTKPSRQHTTSKAGST